MATDEGLWGHLPPLLTAVLPPGSRQRLLLTVDTPGSYMKRELDSNLSGNEVYYTASSLPVISENSCGKLHCQKGFDWILFACEIKGGPMPRDPCRCTSALAYTLKLIQVMSPHLDPEPGTRPKAGGDQNAVILYTLHSTLYTLHPTLYTLHSTPYTLHSTLYTLHSTRYTLHSTLYASAIRACGALAFCRGLLLLHRGGSDLALTKFEGISSGRVLMINTRAQRNHQTPGSY